MRSHSLVFVTSTATLLIVAGCTVPPPASPDNEEGPILRPPPVVEPLPDLPVPEKLPVPQSQPPQPPPEDPSPPQFKIIFFDEDSSDIPAQDRPSIDFNVAQLRRHPRTTVVIEGHCNESGSETYNFELGWRRAESVARAFENAGISRTRMEIVSRGKDEPLELGHARDAWTTNRASIVQER